MFKAFSLLQSVHFICSVVSDSVQPHGLQHTRIPCPSPTPRACWNSSPSIPHAIQPSHPLSSPSPWHSSFLASGSLPMRQFFASVWQSTGVAASASVLLVNNQDWYHMSMEWWLHGHRRDERSYSMFKVRSGGSEEYTSSKLRNSGCALLEQPWRYTPRPR